MPTLDAATLAVVFAFVFLGGVVKGAAGFGYAVVATASIAAVVDPATAVVLVIIPSLAANLSLLRELDRDALQSCLVRFWPYLAAAVVGTAVGMALLERVPRAALALALGVFTLAYVAFRQPYASVPEEARLRAHWFRDGVPAKAALGLVSGALFGASNVAVQIVAYLDSRDLDRATFVGVLAMILVGVSTLRVGMAWGLGLYGSSSLVAYSAIAAVPGLIGVTAGARLGARLSPRVRVAGVLALLTVVGVRLVSTGLAAV